LTWFGSTDCIRSKAFRYVSICEADFENLELFSRNRARRQTDRRPFLSLVPTSATLVRNKSAFIKGTSWRFELEISQENEKKNQSFPK